MNSIFRTWKISLISVLIAVFMLICPAELLAAEIEEAVFAGGCFWCLEHDLEKLSGVNSVVSGYTGGDLQDPTYQNHQGHQEAVKVKFDSDLITYSELLRSYWRNIDPFDGDGQFCDKGDSYRPVIFTLGDEQEIKALNSYKAAAVELGKPLEEIKVRIQPVNKFWLAEEYHQNFADENNFKYNFYRYSCGRDQRLNDVWDDRARTISKWKEGRG